MSAYIARMIDCGMTRETAVAICRYYIRHGSVSDLADYVSELEEEAHVEMDTV